ncbi:MAG: hypothetical protein IKY00_00765, partial [Clostridia bacterium]|nr:hypothetical protein [Clostridia bacterium]
RLICSAYKADNVTPFDGDPRNIFKRVIDEAAAEGYGFNVDPECEFFLFKLRYGNGNIFHNTEQIGKLQADKFNIVFQCALKYLFFCDFAHNSFLRNQFYFSGSAPGRCI